MDNLSDAQIRKWYIAHSGDIPNMVDKSATLEDRARQAHALRNIYRAQARGMMQDKDAAMELGKRKPNLGFEELVLSKIKRKGLTREEAYHDIIASAAQTNKQVNKDLGLEGTGNDGV